MIRLFTFLWAIVFFSPVLLFSQNAPLVKVWDKTFGGSGEDLGRYILPTSDGGFLLRGISYSGAGGDKSEIGRGDCDVWLVRVDANGNKLWDKTYGGTGEDRGWRMVQTTDGGFAIVSSSTSGISGEKSEASRGLKDSWLLRIDANGNKLWDKTYGGTGHDGARMLIQTPDGGFMICSDSNSPISGEQTSTVKGIYDYWIVKTDANGNKLWDKTIGGNQMDMSHAVYPLNDGFLLGGFSESGASGDKSQSNQGASDFWVVKLDYSGNIIWEKSYGGNRQDQLTSITATIDNGFLLMGHSESTVSGDKSESSRGGWDYWVVKIDANGNKLWDKTFGGSGNEILYSGLRNDDGTFLLIGQSTSTITGDKTEVNRGAQNIWVVKIDANGNKLWDKTIGGSGSEEIYGSCFAQNGDLMLLASSNSPVSGDKSQPSRGGNDFWLVRMTDLTQSNVTGLRVIEPITYANKGKVTMNLYGLPFDQNSTAKLVRNGFPDIIAENVTYLDSFLIQAVFNVDQKEVGQYSVRATLRNNQVSTLDNAFTLENARVGQICPHIVGSDRIRTTWTSNYVISLTQDGNTDLHNVPLWVSMSDIGEVNPQFQIFDQGQSVWQDNYWNEPAFVQNGKKYYALLVPKVAHGVSTFINFQIKAPNNAGQRIELEAWTTLPWEGNPYHHTGVPCLQSGLASILTDAIPQTLNNGDLFNALNVSTDSLSLNLERQGLVNSPKTYPTVLPQSQVYYASAIEALQRMNMPPSQSQQNALQQTIRQYLARVAEAEISPRSVQCTPQNWLNLQLCANQSGVTPLVITNMNEQTIIIDGSNLDQNPPVWNPHTQNQQNVHCITHSEVYTPHCKGTFVIIIVGAYDPNQKSGISQRYIKQAGKLNYLIEYENQPQASAPAHEVFIYDTLDAQVFDLTTFRFGAVGFGTHFSAPIVDYPQMQTDIDMRPIKPYIVRVKGEINDNIVKWHFATLDAQTLQPITDPTGGFLPPNQLSPNGQGFVHFSVASKADAPSGTMYRNKASIVFDSNAPIITNTHENVLDKIAPQSRVTALPVQVNKSSFTLNWSGTDSGSGIEDYTIYVSENNGDYQVWLKNVNYTSAQFSGKIGNRYRFYSIARDKAGNWETTPNSPDAQSQITQPVADDFNRLKPYLFDCVPNPFASTQGTKVWFYVPTEAYVQISVVNLNGDPVLEVFNAKTRTGRQSADLQGLPTGIYTVKMTTGNYVGFRRIVVTQ